MSASTALFASSITLLGLLRFGGKVESMGPINNLLRYVPATIVALVEEGMQVSGITNLPLAIGLWSLAAALFVLAAWHSAKGKISLSDWRLQSISQSWRRVAAVALDTSSFLPEKSRQVPPKWHKPWRNSTAAAVAILAAAAPPNIMTA